MWPGVVPKEVILEIIRFSKEMNFVNELNPNRVDDD
jgi:hypothetical protein